MGGLRAAVFLLTLLGACGGGPPPVSGQPVPLTRSERAAAIEQFGRELYSALAEGKARALLLNDVELRSLLTTPAASRLSAQRRTRASAAPRPLAEFAGTRYLGVCLQGARQEPAQTALGLRKPAWVFDRILVVGTQGDAGRLAAWVEGSFIFTNQGFAAVVLERVEDPRWDHADLEIAPCDMEVGIR